ncbi:MAG: bifunctional pyr operon transcriptional regulator/uracil phosphoribosyltransferase PyrR [Deltaproteobacteria bacterium]|nr:bifunctional pyr operon transcriptional regulator/uracil phosphoribosyltransferase PyrR [Deltaproteobacteria bacterium]
MVDPLPVGARRVLEHDDVRRVIARLAHDVDDRLRQDSKGPLALDPLRLALVGVRTGGAHLALRLAKELERVTGRLPEVGLLDITLYRDDVLTGAMPLLRGTEIDFDVEGRPLVLVDDVLFTGRTVRAALDALLDLGRPSCVRLAVLVDRGLRELPIAADFTGRALETTRQEHVSVQLVEEGHAEDAVVVAVKAERRSR